jgi:hypothetical protein
VIVSRFTRRAAKLFVGSHQFWDARNGRSSKLAFGGLCFLAVQAARKTTSAARVAFEATLIITTAIVFVVESIAAAGLPGQPSASRSRPRSRREES